MTTETPKLSFSKKQLERALIMRADGFEDFVQIRTEENGVMRTAVKITEPQTLSVKAVA